MKVIYTRSTPSEVRFLAKVEKDASGCWLWCGDRTHGYGRFKVAGGRVQAHRWAYERWVGPIPVGLTIDHLCRMTACVNPAHLEAVTIGENLLRGDTFQARNAAKTRCPGGHPYDTANTYLDPRGGRQCRVCKRLRQRTSAHRAYNREYQRQWRERRRQCA